MVMLAGVMPAGVDMAMAAAVAMAVAVAVAATPHRRC